LETHVFRRRYILLTAVIATVLLVDATTGGPSDAPPPAPAGTFGFADVDQLARSRASQAYKDGSGSLPDSLADLGYDQYRDIRFRPANALWRGKSLFEVQFFHRGFNFDRRVNIAEVTPEGVKPIAYDPKLFDYKALKVPKDLPPETGFAGLRVHYPLHTPAYKDELIVFLGASYFRALGRNQGYGISARGLALDTAADRGEEFPYFTDFWLVRPGGQDRSLVVYALLDSKSVTGAYRFDIRPGSITQVEVSSKLYFRRVPEKLGIAPLTSMFLFGEDPSGRRFDDFRPEVHDSDGLVVQTGKGEWLWRPVSNPKTLRVSRFLDDSPRGFGLSQRDRDFAHYQDNESHFERRPSYWVEPLGRWGRGSIELVELPSNEEIHDNVVAYWVPAEPPDANKPVAFSYLISAHSSSNRWPPGGKVVATRIGNAAIGGYDKSAARRVLIDFEGGDLDGLDKTQPVKVAITANGAKVDAVTVERIAGSGTWRAAFRVTPGNPNDAIDMRAYLTLYGEAMSETWTYLWKPEA
jgi:glucans biosynthesis protein